MNGIKSAIVVLFCAGNHEVVVARLHPFTAPLRAPAARHKNVRKGVVRTLDIVDSVLHTAGIAHFPWSLTCPGVTDMNVREGNCTSTCDAQAECGRQCAKNGLRLVATTVLKNHRADFCRSCGGDSAGAITMGYYESWSYTRTCNSWSPETITPSMWTYVSSLSWRSRIEIADKVDRHLNYGFALIGSDNRIAQMNDFDVELYSRFTGLKQINPALKTYISVGGWSASGEVFSKMVATSTSRSTFIQSTTQFMNTYGFDGIDIDWEYPAAADRGGVAVDTKNYVALLSELKAAIGSKGLTVTLPSSYQYMQGFDVIGMEKYVDWFNFLSYDIHVVQPHTNLTEITQGLDLLWRNNIDPGKVVLGLAFCGRSFTLKDPSCDTPGCPFSGVGNPGPCTQTSGILSDAEIDQIITNHSLTPTLNAEAVVKCMSWDYNQWVSYDDDETIGLKKAYASSNCLGGTMVWALDLADANYDRSSLNLIAHGMATIDGNQALQNKQYAGQKYRAIQQQNVIGSLVFWTSCSTSPACPAGCKCIPAFPIHTLNTESSSDTEIACPGGPLGATRALCIKNDVDARGCGWYGVSKGCSQQCPKNTILVALNTAPGGARIGCKTGKFASYCCSAISASRVGQCSQTQLNNQLSNGFGSIIVQNKHLSPYDYGDGTTAECLAKIDPFLNPYLNQVMGPGGKGAIFQPISNRMYLDTNNSQDCTTTVASTLQPITPRFCHIVFSGFSVDQLFSDSGEHSSPRHCKILYESLQETISRIRRVPDEQNAGADQADQLRSRFRIVTSETTNGGAQVVGGTCFQTESLTVTLPRFSLEFANSPDDAQDDLGTNWCQLASTFVDDAGSALFTQDQWYIAYNRNNSKQLYAQASIPASLSDGHIPPRALKNYAKRWLQDDSLSLNELILNDGNSSRYKSDQDLYQEYGLERCTTHDCLAERIQLEADLATLLANAQAEGVAYLARRPSPAVTAGVAVSTDACLAMAVRAGGGCLQEERGRGGKGSR
ncbi:hypothetical protein MRB53_037752 [Persea americana]|nr:hypothetical protein MRB53_037752 [Persea americana]